MQTIDNSGDLDLDQGDTRICYCLCCGNENCEEWMDYFTASQG